MDAHCYMCDAYKPLTEFYRDRTRRNKHCSRCKECESVYEHRRNRNGPRPRQTPAITRPKIERVSWKYFNSPSP